MSNPKFNAIALDELIKDCTGQVDEVSKELATYNNSEIAPQGNPDTSNLLNDTGGSVDYTRVYKGIQRLIENGNNALETLAAVDPDTTSPETMHATASLINTIKNCITEFTKIHTIHLKHELTLQLEAQRQQNRLALIDARLKAKQKNNEEIPTAELSEFSDKTTADIFRYLQQQKNAREEIQK